MYQQKLEEKTHIIRTTYDYVGRTLVQSMVEYLIKCAYMCTTKKK